MTACAVREFCEPAVVHQAQASTSRTATHHRVLPAVRSRVRRRLPFLASDDDNEDDDEDDDEDDEDEEHDGAVDEPSAPVLLLGVPSSDASSCFSSLFVFRLCLPGAPLHT